MMRGKKTMKPMLRHFLTMLVLAASGLPQTLVAETSSANSGALGRDVFFIIVIACVAGVVLVGLVGRFRRRDAVAEIVSSDGDRRRGSLTEGAVAFGVCDICGQTAEITCRRMPMYRGHGKCEPVEEEGLLYLSCSGCYRKVAPNFRNCAIAAAMGVFLGISPLIQTSPVDWHLRQLLGWWTDLMKVVAMFLPLLLAFALAKVGNRHFGSLEAFRTLRARGFWIGFGNLSETLRAVFLGALASAAFVFLILGGLRLWQDRWSRSVGVVTACEERFSKHKNGKYSSEIVHVLRVRYRYAYKIGDVPYTGVAYGELRKVGKPVGTNPWKEGACVEIDYDPHRPELSVARKVDPSRFGKDAAFVLFLYGVVWIGQLVSERRRLKGAREHP